RKGYHRKGDARKVSVYLFPSYLFSEQFFSGPLEVWCRIERLHICSQAEEGIESNERPKVDLKSSSKFSPHKIIRASK
ncbi:MAG TPA: hypothetical protein PLX30_03650, partial [Methanothrix sp.]|nr:hypothetical protein [Methanothrix sp.]